MSDRETYESRLRQIERLRDAVIKAALAAKRECEHALKIKGPVTLQELIAWRAVYEAVQALEAAEKEQ